MKVRYGGTSARAFWGARLLVCGLSVTVRVRVPSTSISSPLRAEGPVAVTCVVKDKVFISRDSFLVRVAGWAGMVCRRMCDDAMLRKRSQTTPLFPLNFQ